MSGDDAIRRAAERIQELVNELRLGFDKQRCERIIREELGDVEKLRAERDEAVALLGRWLKLGTNGGQASQCPLEPWLDTSDFLARVKP